MGSWRRASVPDDLRVTFIVRREDDPEMHAYLSKVPYGQLGPAVRGLIKHAISGGVVSLPAPKKPRRAKIIPGQPFAPEPSVTKDAAEPSQAVQETMQHQGKTHSEMLIPVGRATQAVEPHPPVLDVQVSEPQLTEEQLMDLQMLDGLMQQ